MLQSKSLAGDQLPNGRLVRCYSVTPCLTYLSQDWKRGDSGTKAINQGDDIAGVVHAVGENVTEFKPGDRIAAFHEMMAPGGSYAEYAVSWQHATFHLPKKTTFEGALHSPGYKSTRLARPPTKSPDLDRICDISN